LRHPGSPHRLAANVPDCFDLHGIDVHIIMGMSGLAVKCNSLQPKSGIFSASRRSTKHFRESCV
jgi:hypothetical protein